MPNTIQIKRSQTTATPPTLAVGEMAWSEQSQNLFIGESGSVVKCIAGPGSFVKKTDGLTVSGDATVTGSFGAGLALTLAASGVGAGTYAKVTVNAKGLVTAGTTLAASDIPSLDWAKIATGKPTTLSGYGITDGLGLTSAAAAALAGSASAGSATTAARADHVHPLPAAADVGAVATTAVGAANGVASLDAGGKVPTSQLPDAVTGALSYQGTWNAATNTPTIPAASSSNKGYYYKVATAGSTNVSGITDWQVGDWIVSNGSAWDKIDNTEAVSSVNGQTGAVTISTVSGNASTATALQTARSIALGGDATGSVSFNGSANVTITVTFANSGVSAGTYPKVTVDAKGRVTAGSSLAASDIPSLDWSKIMSGKPTTLAGYGITDALASSSTIDGGTF